MAVEARHIRSVDGRTFQLGRITPTFKASVAETGGAYTLCEAIEPAACENVFSIPMADRQLLGGE